MTSAQSPAPQQAAGDEGDTGKAEILFNVHASHSRVAKGAANKWLLLVLPARAAIGCRHKKIFFAALQVHATSATKVVRKVRTGRF